MVTEPPSAQHAQVAAPSSAADLAGGHVGLADYPAAELRGWCGSASGRVSKARLLRRPPSGCRGPLFLTATVILRRRDRACAKCRRGHGPTVRLQRPGQRVRRWPGPRGHRSVHSSRRGSRPHSCRARIRRTGKFRFKLHFHRRDNRTTFHSASAFLTGSGTAPPLSRRAMASGKILTLAVTLLDLDAEIVPGHWVEVLVRARVPTRSTQLRTRMRMHAFPDRRA